MINFRAFRNPLDSFSPEVLYIMFDLVEWATYMNTQL